MYIRRVIHPNKARRDYFFPYLLSQEENRQLITFLDTKQRIELVLDHDVFGVQMRVERFIYLLRLARLGKVIERIDFAQPNLDSIDITVNSSNIEWTPIETRLSEAFCLEVK